MVYKIGAGTGGYVGPDDRTSRSALTGGCFPSGGYTTGPNDQTYWI